MIGTRENVRESSSNFGFTSVEFTRVIAGRTYRFMRREWRRGEIELWAQPVGTTKGSRHRIRGWAQ